MMAGLIAAAVACLAMIIATVVVVTLNRRPVDWEYGETHGPGTRGKPWWLPKWLARGLR